MTTAPTREPRRKTRVIRSKWFIASALIIGAYVGSFATIKLLRPAFLTSNDGPGRVYCSVYFPLRFSVASAKGAYWRRALAGHWQTVKVVWNNPGNGYLEFENLGGRSGRVFAGAARTAKEGEAIDIHLSHELRTWDDFSDHLIAGVDKVRRPKG